MQKSAQKIITILIILLIAGAGYYFYFGKSSQIKQQTALTTTQVKRDTIRSTIKVLGKSALVDEQQLRFNQIGKVAAVYFKDGDSVKKDQVIAELDKTDVFNEIRQAEINLQNSRLNLEELLKGNTEASILKAENSLLDTKQKIDTATKNLAVVKQDEKNTLQELDNEIVSAEKEVADKEKSLEAAKKDLENTKVFEGGSMQSSSNTYQSSIDDALLEVKDAILEADNILVKLDAVLGMEENTKTNNDAFEEYLGALSVNTKNQAESSYTLSKIKRIDLENAYNQLVNKETILKTDVIDLLEIATDTFQTIVTASDNTYIMLQNTITGAELSSSELDSYKSSVSGARSSAQSKFNALQNSITTLNNLETLDITGLRSSDAIRKKEDAVSSAQYALEKSEDALKTLKDTLEVKKENKRLERVAKENDLASLQNSLKAQEIDLADLKKGATEERITMAKNDIVQKELSLANVQKNVEKYELRAPFDGSLRQIDFQTGDNLLADDDKFVYIENPDLLKITILLDQIDIVKIKKGYKTHIIFDSFPEKTFTGEIEAINQTPVEQSGVISYEASIILNKGNDSIFSGMTASIEVIIQEKNNILIVPNLAIASKAGKVYVKKIMNGTTQEIEVETGITDGKNTEILSGLKEGDEIIEIDFQSQNQNTNTSSQTNGSQTNGSQANGQDNMRQLMRATGGH